MSSVLVSNVPSSNKYVIVDSASIPPDERCGFCYGEPMDNEEPLKKKWSLVHNGHYVGHWVCIKEWIKSSGNSNCLICHQAMDLNSVFSWKERKLLQMKSCGATVLKWMPEALIVSASAALTLALAPPLSPPSSSSVMGAIAGGLGAGLGAGLGSFLGISLVCQVTRESIKVVDFLLEKSFRVQPDLAREERDARIHKWMTYGLKAGVLNGAVCTTVAGITMLKLACLIQDVSPWGATLLWTPTACGMLGGGGLAAYNMLTADLAIAINRPEDAFLEEDNNPPAEAL